MGQSKEAVEAYISAAQRALARGDQAECEKLADKAIKLDPHNLAALIVKARVHSTQGNFAQAAELLEKVPDLEKGGEQTELLLDLYVKSGKWDEGIQLAQRVFDATVADFGFLHGIKFSGSLVLNPDCTGTFTFTTSAGTTRTDTIIVLGPGHVRAMSQDVQFLWTYDMHRL